MIIELIPEQNKMYDKQRQEILEVKGEYFINQHGYEVCVPGSIYAEKNLLPVFKVGNDYGFVERKYL